MYTCIRTRRPHKVMVSARSTLSSDVCSRHKAWDDRLLYKVCERRPRSQCVYIDGRERLHKKAYVKMYRRISMNEVE